MKLNSDRQLPDRLYWYVVSKRNQQALALAARHYTRQKARGEMGPPGQKIILLTADSKAVWGSHRPAPWTGIKRQDKHDAHCCFIFRNEGPFLSSDLIREAVGLTARVWGTAPEGFITYTAIDEVQSSNPGYCFLQAGFLHAGYTRSSKLGRLRKLIMPEQTVKQCKREIDKIEAKEEANRERPTPA